MREVYQVGPVICIDWVMERRKGSSKKAELDAAAVNITGAARLWHRYISGLTSSRQYWVWVLDMVLFIALVLYSLHGKQHAFDSGLLLPLQKQNVLLVSS